MRTAIRIGLLLTALAGAGVMLTACADEKALTEDTHASDFGRATQEDFAAQIADPDAAYKGPPPPSSGDKAALAQSRYRKGAVIQPAGTSTLQIQGGGGGSGGGSGGGGGGSTGP